MPQFYLPLAYGFSLRSSSEYHLSYELYLSVRITIKCVKVYWTNLSITKPERGGERAPLIGTEVFAGIKPAFQNAGLRSSEPHLSSLTATAQPPPTTRRTTCKRKISCIERNIHSVSANLNAIQMV